MEPEPELLQPKVGRAQYLDGVVMDVGGDTGAFFLPGPDELTEQGLAVHVFRHHYFQAPAEDRLSPLRFTGISDVHYRYRDVPDPYAHDRDDRWELAGVAAAAHEFEVMTGLTPWPGAPAGEHHGFPGEKRSDGHAVDPMLLEAEQGRGRGVGLDDPAP
jgi:hypothetical protein